MADQLHLMLGIGSKGIGMLVDIAGGGRQRILPPVGPDDGGGSTTTVSPKGGNVEDGFQLTFHGVLFFRLHIVADGIVLGGDIILFAIAEMV